ncbi:MAG: toll/interleukin-1 receptor domain-containing protein [Clostridia bacterium]|nr:toll/interleukin-1 receptor domain-containing protein [Clostridia bacterium]
MTNQAYEYDAFISYSHRDMNWGRWLQARLESWRIPADVRKKQCIRGKHLKVFRDQTDLAGVELQESIQRELRLSRYLIVICSPNSAASPWVAAEIAYFKQLGREQNIIPFIVEGEPETDKPELECYSAELRNVQDHHYLGANVQELGKQKAFLRLISILLDVRFNRLVDRDRRRKRIRVTAIVSAVMIAAAVTGTLLWRNWQTENEKRYLQYGNVILEWTENNAVSPDMVDMLEQSALAGNEQACLMLGDSYQRGRGVEVNPEEAFRWFELGASYGNDAALAAVGNCYINGEGVAKDVAAALPYYEKAAEKGNTEAMINLALCLLYGEGTQADPLRAAKLFAQAAEQGNTRAMIASANLCMDNGSPEQAFRWMKMAAENGDAEAMFNTAMMLQNAIGTEENPEEAFRWLWQSAQLGDKDAMYMVGWCLDHRYGIDDPALIWYRQAAELGSENAKRKLEEKGAGAQ